MNDNFASASFITGATNSVSGSNVGATKETGEPTHFGIGLGQSVWWDWTAPDDWTVSVDAFGSSFYTVVAIYTGNSVASLTPVVGNFGDNVGLIRFSSVKGTVYHIAVDGWGSSSSGNIVLNLRATPPPSNDQFAKRSVLTGLTNSAAGSLYGATREPGEPNDGSMSIWWKWTTPTNGPVTLDVLGTAFTPPLAVYTGDSVESLTLVAQNGDTVAYLSGKLSFFGLAGTTYQIAVVASPYQIDTAGQSGSALVLRLEQHPSHANDALADGISIVGMTNSVVGNNSAASKELGEPDHAGNAGGKSLWWTWTASTNAKVTLDTIGSSFDTLLAVYTGNSVTGLTLVASNDDRSEDQASQLSFSARPGTTYQFAVDGWNAASGYMTLNLRAAPAPPNDAFDDRMELTGYSDTVNGDVTGATREPDEPSYTQYGSVWWTWTAPAYGAVTFSVTGNVSGFDIYTGDSISNLTLRYNASRTASFQVLAGTTYQIAIDGTASGSYLLSLEQPPPVGLLITSQPQTVTLFQGYSWTFTVGVSAAGPLSFQWRKDERDIPGATNISYVIPAVQVSDAGAYSVVIISANDRLTSSNAVLSVDGPRNDAFADRFTITGPNVTVSGSNASASKEVGEPNHAGNSVGKSVWWTWTALTNWNVTLDTVGSSFGTVLAVYTGNSVSSLTEVASDSSSFGRTTSMLTFAALADTTYQIAVDGNNGLGGSSGDIMLNLRSAPFPANDAFANRALISGLNGSVTGNNEGAGKEPGEPNHAGSQGGKSVWWTWRAPTNGMVFLDTLGSSFDTLLAVYEGSSLTELTRVAEDDESGTNHTSRLSFFGVRGTTYQIAVDGYLADSGIVALHLEQIPSSGAQPINVAFTGNWPGFRTGNALGLQVIGTLAYVAIGEGGLLILDVGDPQKVVRVGSYDTPGEARSVAVADGFAYIADGRAGVQIIDVHNPALPGFAGQYSGLTNVNRVVVRGNVAYVADGSAGFQVLDVSNRLRPVLLDGLQGSARSLRVQGNYAYVCGNGLEIVNIQNPADIVLMSRFGGYFLDVEVDSNFAFVGGIFQMDIVDVRIAAAPTLVTNIFLSNNPFSGSTTGMFLDGNRLYAAGAHENIGTGFFELDISNPALPQKVGSVEFDSSDPHGIAVAGGRLFLAGGVAGLEIFDKATPRATHDRFETASRPLNLAVQGNFAYLASGARGLQIVDISDPAFPKFAGSTTGVVFSVAVEGAHALVGNVLVGTGTGKLMSIDISDPHVPKYQNSTNVSIIVDLLAQGDRAYALGDTTTCRSCPLEQLFNIDATLLHVFDLADRANPKLLRTEALQFSGRDIAVSGHYGYLIGQHMQNLAILDFNAPGQRFGQLTDVTPDAIDVSKDELAVGGTNGVEVFDISYPTKPVLRGRLTNSVTDLILDQRRLVSVDKNRGLEVIDLGNMTNPISIGANTAIGYEKLKLAGNYALIAHGDQGLTILDLGPTFAAAPGITVQPKGQRVLPGATMRFDVGANGTVPLSYQWRLRGTNLPGATNFVLTIPDIQPGQAGQYSVVISNSVGVTVSSNAFLSVDFLPSVALTAPANDQVFLAPAIITLSAEASDPDTNGSVAQVAFYEDANLLGIVAHAPFSITLSNVPVGTHVFTARATDNEGASTMSAAVTTLVTTDQVFQLSQATYVVAESNHVVSVTVRRNAGGASEVTPEVTLFTQNNSAKAFVPGGVGQYYAFSNRLAFASGELSKDIQITNVNDLVYRGNLNYLVKLSNPSAGWNLTYPSNAVVTILEDDSPTNNVFPDVAMPGNPVNGRGSLTVLVEPPEALGKWRFEWETAWRDSGSTASNLVAGEYPVAFIALDRYGPLTNVTNSVQSGTDLVFTNHLTRGVGGTRFGSLSIKILPEAVAKSSNPDARGQWRLQGTTTWSDSESVIANLPAGLHRIEFKPAIGVETPDTLSAEVVHDETVLYEVAYSTATPGLNVLPNFSTIINAWQSGLPYAVCGQLDSSAGFGSGFVVKPHTVLTAGHVVFDPVTLSYVHTVRWFFQRHAGENETPPLPPRGWYVLDGYAAERNKDFRERGLNSNESSPESQQLDMAALYFLGEQGAGHGGYGGYLTSDPAGHVWLTNTSLKLLVGYPVENVPEANRGKLHRVGPDNFAFDLISTNLSLDGVYGTQDMVGYGGMSGGPVCVQSTNSLGQPFFIPAGVYLGGSGGSTVRSIDLDVVDLINRAEASGNTDTNHAGGGVVLIIGSYGSVSHPSSVQVRFGPPSAGGKWRVSPINYGDFYGAFGYYTNYTDISRLLVFHNPNFAIEVMDVPGFVTPTNRVVTIKEGATELLDLSYSVLPPQLVFDRVAGLGIIAKASNTGYRIETASELSSGTDWIPVDIVSWTGGTNWIPGTAIQGFNTRFYRAVWLP